MEMAGSLGEAGRDGKGDALMPGEAIARADGSVGREVA
jgi:hypothetical protein